MSRFGWILAVVLVAAGCWWLYQHNTNKNAFGSGLVIAHDTSADANDDATSSAPKTTTTAGSQLLPATPPPAPQPTPAPAPKPSAALPVSDTIDRNPPVGMAFGGSGRYQWYRQGDITWRVNTETGKACIDFATMEEWRRKIVYTHGCGNA
jgi:hypothetical protein